MASERYSRVSPAGAWLRASGSGGAPAPPELAADSSIIVPARTGFVAIADACVEECTPRRYRTALESILQSFFLAGKHARPLLLQQRLGKVLPFGEPFDFRLQLPHRRL